MTSPDVVDSIQALRNRLASAPRPVGLVPTMGALHAGHARLIEEARRDCGSVVVSIFVNPLQFERQDDLRKYPANLEKDVALCASHGADVVFAPGVAVIYPETQICTIDVGSLADHLCGPFRPGHFQGVATVVMKFLQIVGPDIAYFGEKDAQQLAIVRRLVSDFNVPARIAGVATVRDADGLALSSRNARLGPAERAIAPVLYRALSEALRLIQSGSVTAHDIVAAASAVIPQIPSVRLEYIEVVDPVTLQPVDVVAGPVLVAGAMWLGETRLIDNLSWVPSRKKA